MPKRTLHFYFDFLSPYAYLAWFNLKKLIAKHGLELEVHPVVLAALLKQWGHKGPAEIPPKREFSFKDCIRKSDEAGVSFFPPPFHPFNPLSALRLSTKLISGKDQKNVIDLIWRTIWGEGKDGGSEKVLTEVLDKNGFPGEEWIKKIRDPDVKEELKKETAAALEKGAFGVPTMILGEELFWGNDQIKFLELYLEGRDPLSERNIKEILSRPASASR